MTSTTSYSEDVSYTLTIGDGRKTVYVWFKDDVGNVSDSANDSITLSTESIPTNGLVAYYPFNGNANDESGNGNNGTVNGATLTTDRDGNANSACSFDEGNDMITISHYSGLELANGTWTVWILNSSSGNGGDIISQDTFGYNNDGFISGGSTTNAVDFKIEASGTSYRATSADNITTSSSWHFLAVT